MKVLSLKRLFAAAVFPAVLIVSAHAGAADGCPSADEASKTIAATFRQGIVVKDVSAGPFEGLCEIIITFNGRNDILYSDTSGRYFVTGRSIGIVDTETKTNLTRARLNEFNKFSAEDMAKLEALTALSVGSAGPVVYFVTDPE